MSFLVWILFGAIAGWIASYVMKTENSHGLFTDVVLGVIGAIVGGLVMNFFGAAGVTGFNIYSLMVAVIGSVVLIMAGRALYR